MVFFLALTPLNLAALGGGTLFTTLTECVYVWDVTQVIQLNRNWNKRLVHTMRMMMEDVKK